MSNDNLPLVQHPDTYADSFVAIDPASRTLAIKNYHLFKPTYVVPLSALRYILPARDVVHRWGLRQHGYSHGIRWAKDHSRGNFFRGPKSGYDRSFVVKVERKFVRSGFSVEDPDQFLAVLERLRPGITKTENAHDEEDGQEHDVEDDLRLVKDL